MIDRAIKRNRNRRDRDRVSNATYGSVRQSTTTISYRGRKICDQAKNHDRDRDRNGNR